jgi:isopenicillin N synthase-like dioxygenase
MTENESLMEAVPVIDISPFTKDGSLESQQRVAQQFAEKASLNGCVGIRGHNVAHNILTEAFEMTKKLFDLPYDQKMKAPHPDGPIPHRGYSSVGRENAAQKTESENWKGTTKAEEYAHITDFKESYEIGSHDNKVEYNIWLPEGVFPGFREWSLGLYWELQKTAMAILEALIMSLDLEAGEQESVRRLFSGHDNQLRLLHYPPVERGHLNIATDGHRLGAHTDWG